MSAWGARLVEASEPPPVLYPGRSDWQTTEADVLTALQLLASYSGCPACQLPNNVAGHSWLAESGCRVPA